MWDIILVVAAGVALFLYLARRRARLRGETPDKF
jgi:hypothetical protein